MNSSRSLIPFFRLLLIGSLVISCFSGCNDDDRQLLSEPEHAVVLESFEVFDRGMVKLTARFNLAYDSQLQEVGFVVKSIQTEEQFIRKMGLDTLSSLQSIYFENLPSGDYIAKAYLITGSPAAIQYSEPRYLTLAHPDYTEAGYWVKIYSNSEDQNGWPVYELSSHKPLNFSLNSKLDSSPRKIQLRIGEWTFDMPFEKELSYNMYSMSWLPPVDFPVGIYEPYLLVDDCRVPINCRWVYYGIGWIVEPSIYPGPYLSDESRKTSFLYNDYGYVMKYAYNRIDVWRYHFPSQSWQACNAITLPYSLWDLYNCTMVVGETAYIITERTVALKGRKEIYSYHLPTGEWQLHYTLGGDESTSQCAVFKFGTKFFLIFNKMLYSYDVVTGETEESETTDSVKGYGVCGVETAEYAYFTAGWGGLYRYSRTSGIEQMTLPYKADRNGVLLLTHNGKLYAIGGSFYAIPGTYPITDCYCFDESTQRWNIVSRFPSGITNSIGFVYKGRLYAGIGDWNIGSDETASFLYRLDPGL